MEFSFFSLQKKRDVFGAIFFFAATFLLAQVYRAHNFFYSSHKYCVTVTQAQALHVRHIFVSLLVVVWHHSDRDSKIMCAQKVKKLLNQCEFIRNENVKCGRAQ